MTTLGTTIGGLTLPIPAGAANSRIADPLIDGLRDYIGHWIKWALDAKFAMISGPDDVVVSDACPALSRFSYDPGGWWVRTIVERKTPGLWVWGPRWKRIPYSTIYQMRERPIQFLYAFPDQLAPRGSDTRSGLMNAADGALRRAFDRGAHDTYANGVQFVDTIAEPNTLEVFFEDAEMSFEFSAPATGNGAGGRTDGGLQQYGFQCLRGTLIARERIHHDAFVDPDDVLGDMAMTITHNEYGDTLDGLPVLEGTLPGPDGSEDGDEVI